MRILVLTILCLIITNPALALTNQQVENFVNSTKQVLALAAEMETAGKNKLLDAKVREAQDSGTFSPYVTAMETMQAEFPDDHKKLSAITAAHGFPSALDWARVGDKTIQAFIALQMGDNLHSHIATAEAQVNSKEVAALPAEARERMTQALEMLRHIATVSKADQAVVAPYQDRIGAFMKEQAGLAQTP